MGKVTREDRIIKAVRVQKNCVLSVYYDKICLKLASYHFLLYVVYMCQKSLNFTYAFKCYHQKCSWPHFSWPTLYILERKANQMSR